MNKDSNHTFVEEMDIMPISIKEIEYYLPDSSETNQDLFTENPTWNMAKIAEKTGVFNRRISGKDECASDLAVKAAEQLFEKDKIMREDIDMLIFCSQSPDYFLPTTACILQERLDLPTSTGSFDINLGCSAYIYGLAVASSMLTVGLCSNVLLLCADTYSKYIRRNDRTCRPLFADAGTATLLVKSKFKDGIGSFVFGTDGRGMDKLIVRGGAHRYKGEPILKMDGSNLFMFTLSEIPNCVNRVLKKANKRIEDIDFFFFHQASKLIIDNIARKLSLPKSKVFVGFENIGNTVSASIPIAIKQAHEQGQLKKDAQIMLVGFGVGYSWGGCILRWDGLGGEL